MQQRDRRQISSDDAQFTTTITALNRSAERTLMLLVSRDEPEEKKRTQEG